MSVDAAFTRTLPKVELHAHLSGSISKLTLHHIWSTSPAKHDLEDPLTAIQPGENFVDILSFFPLFDKYIYHLITDVETVKASTWLVLEDFRADGVVYLELRTTPRSNALSGMTAEEYVQAVCETLQKFNAGQTDMVVYLILSVDRKMTLAQAQEVVDLALKHCCTADGRDGVVVGIDLCGNPAKGDVSIFMPAFRRAQCHGLKITVHFAEILASSTDAELDTLLSWYPDRLGHVIHVSDRHKAVLRQRKMGLELCISCNVLAKMTTGGFAMHHFGEWWASDCPVALGTDDVGVFDSALSNECLLVAKHFGLGRQELIDLSRRAASVTFGDNSFALSKLQMFKEAHIDQHQP